MKDYGKIFHGEIGNVYYKLYRYKGLITVVCLQDFDEYDYNQSNFIRNSNNEIHIFESEELAIESLIKWFKPEEIDAEFHSYINNSDNVKD